MKSQVHLLRTPLKSKGTCVPNADVEWAGDLGVTQGSVALLQFLEADTPICLLQSKILCVYTCANMPVRVCARTHVCTRMGGMYTDESTCVKTIGILRNLSSETIH